MCGREVEVFALLQQVQVRLIVFGRERDDIRLVRFGDEAAAAAATATFRRVKVEVGRRGEEGVVLDHEANLRVVADEYLREGPVEQYDEIGGDYAEVVQINGLIVATLDERALAYCHIVLVCVAARRRRRRDIIGIVVVGGGRWKARLARHLKKVLMSMLLLLELLLLLLVSIGRVDLEEAFAERADAFE